MRFLPLVPLALLTGAFFNFTSLPVPVAAEPPITIAVTGQSNAVGQGDSAQSVNLPDSVAVEFLCRFSARGLIESSGFFRPLADPMNRLSIVNARSNTGSFVPAMAQAVHRLTGRRVAVSHYALGASGIFLAPKGSLAATWQPGSIYQRNLLEKNAAMMRALGLRQKAPDFVVVAMGEFDGTCLGKYPDMYADFPDSTCVDSAYTADGDIVSYDTPRGFPNPEQLPSAYDNFVRYYRAFLDAGSKVVVLRTGLCYQTGNAQQLRRMIYVERAVVRYLQRAGYAGQIVEVTGAEKFNALGFMKPDGIHYNQAGLNWAGARIGEAIATHQ